MDTNILFQLVAFRTGKLEIVIIGLLYGFNVAVAANRAANATTAAQLTKLFNIYMFRLLYRLNISTMSFYIRLFVQLVRFIHIYVLRALQIFAIDLIKE